MEKNPKNQDKVFELPDSRRVVFVPTEPNGSEWVQREYEEPIILSKQEESKAKALNYDIKKVLTVKQALVQKMTPTDIKKEFGISRATVHKYKQILSVKDMRIHEKDSNNTENVKSVFPIWLTPMFLSVDNTNSHSWGFVLLFFFFIGVWLIDEWEKQKKRRIKHRETTAKLRRLFHHVFDLTFRQYPIVCNSKKEADHWTKLLKHHNNSGRMVHYIERRPIQDNSQHWSEKEKFASDYCKANAHRIREGEDRSDAEWQNLEDLGLLDYLYWSRKDNGMFETSKKYLLDSVKFYADNQQVPTEDKSKKDQFFDLIPEELKT